MANFVSTNSNEVPGTSVMPSSKSTDHRRLFGERTRLPKLSNRQDAAFAAGTWACLIFAGGTEPEPRHLGDAVGVLPFFIGRSSSWPDTFTAMLDRASPFFAKHIWLRVWLPTPEFARQLEKELPMSLSGRATPLRGKALGLKPEVAIDDLQLDVLALAERLGFEALDDQQLLRRLDEIAAKLSEPTTT